MQLHWRKPTPPEIDHEFLWLFVSLGTFLGLSVWWTAHLPTPQCVFHSLTGRPCVTCGATRAAWQFLHGHFAASFFLNPLAFLAYCGVVIFDLYALFVLTTRASRLRIEDLSRAERSLARATAILLVASNWLYLLVAQPV